MNCCIVVHSQIPKYLQNRWQRLQNCAAGYVLGKYANIFQVAYQGLHDKNWPGYLPIKLIKHGRHLRSDKSWPMIDCGEKNNFRQQADEIFNTLPVNIRICENKKSFINKARSFYKDKALARVLPLYNLLFSFFFSYDLIEIFVQLFNLRRCGWVRWDFYVLISIFDHQPICLMF